MNTEQRTDTGLVLRIDSPVIDAIYEIFGAGAMKLSFEKEADHAE